MKYLLYLSFILFLGLQSTPKEVYICNSTASKAYHLKKNCKGLKNCKAKIKKVSLKKAQNYGRKLCRWEKK